MRNIETYQMKKCVFMDTEQFTEAINPIIPSFSMDGIEYEGHGGEYADEDDAIASLSQFLDVDVISIHIDDCDEIGVWIEYEE